MRAREGLDVVCVPTSERTRSQAAELGSTLATLDEMPQLDLVVDGADEFDAELRLVKGGGGALMREKIVAAAALRMIVIADESKFVKTLGASPIPVEIDCFGATATVRHVQQAARESNLTGAVTRRATTAGSPFLTDGGHIDSRLRLWRSAAAGRFRGAAK